MSLALDKATQRPSRVVEVGLVATITRKQVRDTLRERLFWLYAAGFVLLAGGLVLVAGDTPTGAALGRTAASLVVIAQLVVPLIGLTFGVRSVAGEHERGTLRFLLTHPLSRAEVFLGIYTGAAVGLLATVAAGFGAAGLLSAIRAPIADPWLLVRVAGASWLLALVMLAIGMLLGALVRRTTTAMAGALFVWLAFGFLGDLGMMGTAVATRLDPSLLLLSALANPVEAFRLSGILSLTGTLDALGPAGLYAVERFGSRLSSILTGTLAVWAGTAAGVACWAFRRRIDL